VGGWVGRLVGGWGGGGVGGGGGGGVGGNHKVVLNPSTLSSG